MDPDQIRAAVTELRAYVKRTLAGRNLDDLSSSEQSAIYEAADAHVERLFGIRGWDAAALVKPPRRDEIPEGEFQTWKALYEDLEALQDVHGLFDLTVYGDYAGDHMAAVYCPNEIAASVVVAVNELLVAKPEYSGFLVRVWGCSKSGNVVQTYDVSGP
jgi:hypothetical protein